MGAIANVTKNTTQVRAEDLPTLEVTLTAKLAEQDAQYSARDPEWTTERCLRRNLAFKYKATPRGFTPAKADALPAGTTLERINELLQLLDARWELSEPYDTQSYATPAHYVIEFTGEKCSDGEDELENMRLFESFVRGGSVLAMENEYGNKWRYKFDGTHVTLQSGRVVYN